MSNTQYLFFDTETTGRPLNYKAPVSDLDNWPRLVQLAWQLTDATGNVLETGNHLVRPEGFVIPLESQKIHGISTERALSEGKPLNLVLAGFLKALAAGPLLVAHNADFDRKVLGAEFLRATGKDAFENQALFCTMQNSTKWANIPGKYGPKWPTLTELHDRLFGTGVENAHDAMQDILATARIFFALKEKGVFRV